MINLFIILVSLVCFTKSFLNCFFVYWQGLNMRFLILIFRIKRLIFILSFRGSLSFIILRIEVLLVVVFFPCIIVDIIIFFEKDKVLLFIIILKGRLFMPKVIGSAFLFHKIKLALDKYKIEYKENNLHNNLQKINFHLFILFVF